MDINTTEISNVFQINLKNSERIPWSSLIDTVSCIKLETNEFCMISRIGKIAFLHDTIVVFDDNYKNRRLLLFTKDGKYLNQFPRRGKGPGESIRLSDFQVDALTQNLYLLDKDLNKVIVYNKDGRFLKEHRIDKNPNYFAMDKSNFYFDLTRIKRDKENMYQCFKMDREFKIIEKFLPYEKTINGLEVLSPIYPFQYFKDRINYLPPYQNNVYEIKGDSIRVKYNFDFGKYWLKEEYFFGLDVERLSKALEKSDCGVFSLGCYENNQNIYLGFYHKGFQFYEYLYDKKTKKSVLIKNNKAENNILKPPLLALDNEFVYALSPMDLDKLLKEDKNLLAKFSIFTELTNSLNMEANPIILKVKFKTIEN